MTEKRPITLLLAVLSLLNGAAIVRTNVWFGAFWFVFGILFVAQYFSAAFRDFIERNRIPILGFYLVSFGAVGVHFYTEGKVLFALVLGVFMAFIALMLSVEIWAKRKFPHL